MSARTLLIIATVIGILLLILGLAISIISKKKSKKIKQIVNDQILKEKQFFKQFKPIKFKKWNKYESGIVISSGKKKFNSINNNFVIKNLKKKKSKKIKQLDYQKLSVCVSDKKSSIVVAPPGSGKTQALLLPTILYMLNCKEKPNLIITDPKPEIYSIINDQLIKNKYNIINLSTKQITNSNDEFQSDFWNIFDEIIYYHKKLIDNKNDLFLIQDYKSKIQTNINKILDYFKTIINKNNDNYWEIGGIGIIKFLIAFILNKIEKQDLNYEHLNIHNLKTNLDCFSPNELRICVKEIRTDISNKITLISNIANNYTNWYNERNENISSYINNALNLIDVFSENYIAMLTSKTTFDIDQIIQCNKPFVIFLTINTSSSAHVGEKTLLKVWLSLINSKIDNYKQNNENFKERPLWWLLDECGNIPKLDFLKTIISFGRGRNEFALPIFQSEPQMKEIYGDELIASCENKIFFTNDNDVLAKRISVLSGQYEKEFEDGKTTKNINLEIENICNIPNGYIGLFKYKRNQNEKVFYISPVTYFYMLKNIVINSKLKSNKKYLLDEYSQDFYSKKEINDENKILENNRSKCFKYWYLNIDYELVFSSPDKSRCIQLLNSIQIDLDYFRFNESIDIKKIEKINERFSLLQKILNNELSDSLIAKFLNLANNNKNILYGESLEKIGEIYEKTKTKENQ